MNIKIINRFVLPVALFVLALPAFAVCPVCVFAVGAGVGLSRWLGIDDSITGVWIGALLIAVSLWTANWFNKRNWTFRGMPLVVSVVYYALIGVPLVLRDIIGHPLNKLWGIDKLLLGIIVGTIGFILGTYWYTYLKGKNDGRPNFKFQKVIMPAGVLLVLSAIFYFLTK